MNPGDRKGSEMKHVFAVVDKKAEFSGNQITSDVVRNDGKVVRHGMWPDSARADCALLNLCVANDWPAAKYLQLRADAMRNT